MSVSSYRRISQMNSTWFEEKVLEPYGLLPVFCGTWCSEPDVLEVARSLGATPSSAQPAIWPMVEDDTVLVGRFGDWTLALENTTRMGGDKQTLTALSTGGRRAVNY